MKITINVPARLARDVIGGAHCGYWMNGYKARVRGDGSGLYIGKPLPGHEQEDCEDKPKPFVGARQIADALATMLASGNANTRQCAARVLGGDGDGDGPDMDHVLQVAAYGKLVWG